MTYSSRKVEQNKAFDLLAAVVEGDAAIEDGVANDVISSYYMIGTQVTVLHEDIHWTGQTYSTVLAYPPPDTRIMNLGVFGWNDRASSLETW